MFAPTDTSYEAMQEKLEEVSEVLNATPLPVALYILGRLSGLVLAQHFDRFGVNANQAVTMFADLVRKTTEEQRNTQLN